MKSAYRYAIYYAPSLESEFWNLGSEWLGRCAATQMKLPQPLIDAMPVETFHQLTHAPRRYGWHATLKAPFSLHPEFALDDLVDAVRRVCHQFKPFVMPRLEVRRLDDFLALVPNGDVTAIRQVANQCVTDLHPLTEALSESELSRRRTSPLSAEQDQMLVRWGYPYVLEHFKFHMSLTGSLSACRSTQVQSLVLGAERIFNRLAPPVFDAVAIFAEPVQGADFVLIDHVRFGT